MLLNQLSLSCFSSTRRRVYLAGETPTSSDYKVGQKPDGKGEGKELTDLKKLAQETGNEALKKQILAEVQTGKLDGLVNLATKIGDEINDNHAKALQAALGKEKGTDQDKTEYQGLNEIVTGSLSGIKGLFVDFQKDLTKVKSSLKPTVDLWVNRYNDFAKQIDRVDLQVSLEPVIPPLPAGHFETEFTKGDFSKKMTEFEAKCPLTTKFETKEDFALWNNAIMTAEKMGSPADIKTLQQSLGVVADGQWGPHCTMRWAKAHGEAQTAQRIMTAFSARHMEYWEGQGREITDVDLSIEADKKTTPAYIQLNTLLGQIKPSKSVDIKQVGDSYGFTVELPVEGKTRYYNFSQAASAPANAPFTVAEVAGPGSWRRIGYVRQFSNFSGAQTAISAYEQTVTKVRAQAEAEAKAKAEKPKPAEATVAEKDVPPTITNPKDFVDKIKKDSIKYFHAVDGGGEGNIYALDNDNNTLYVYVKSRTLFKVNIGQVSGSGRLNFEAADQRQEILPKLWSTLEAKGPQSHQWQNGNTLPLGWNLPGKETFYKLSDDNRFLLVNIRDPKGQENSGDTYYWEKTTNKFGPYTQSSPIRVDDQPKVTENLLSYYPILKDSKLQDLVKSGLLKVDPVKEGTEPTKVEFIRAQLEALSQLPDKVLNFIRAQKVTINLSANKPLTQLCSSLPSNFSDLLSAYEPNGKTIVLSSLHLSEKTSEYLPAGVSILHEISHAIQNVKGIDQVLSTPEIDVWLNKNLTTNKGDTDKLNTLKKEFFAESMGCQLFGCPEKIDELMMNVIMRAYGYNKDPLVNKESVGKIKEIANLYRNYVQNFQI